jgi:hypothetical protein
MEAAPEVAPPFLFFHFHSHLLVSFSEASRVLARWRRSTHPTITELLSMSPRPVGFDSHQALGMVTNRMQVFGNKEAKKYGWSE